MELVLGMALKLYTSVVKRLKLCQKNLVFNPYFCRSYSGKTRRVAGLFAGGGRGANLFKTFIKVRYNLTGTISS